MLGETTNLQKSGSNNTDSFIELIDKLDEVFKSNQIFIRKYTHQALITFSRFSSDKQSQILASLSDYLDTCIEANRRNIKLKDTKGLLRFCLERLGLKAPESMYEKMQMDDVVEAYNLEEMQIFRSLAFMELCNYTIADVLMHEWYALYNRDEETTQYIQQDIGRTLSSENNVLTCSIPTHLMTEKFSSPQGTFECDFKYMSPLFSGPDTRSGLLCIIRARDLGARDTSLMPNTHETPHNLHLVTT